MKSERIVKVVLALGLAAVILVPSPAERFAEEEIEAVEVSAAVYKEHESLYDVALSEEVQRYIMNVCRYYSIDTALVLAVIEQESGCDAAAVGADGESLGLMQINPRWHVERMDRLEATDLLDPYENIAVGVDILAEKLAEGLGTEWALAAYNGGNRYANGMREAGKVSSYVKEVMERAEELRERKRPLM